MLENRSNGTMDYQITLHCFFKKLHFIFGENNILTNNVNDQLKEKPSRHVGTQAEALSSR